MTRSIAALTFAATLLGCHQVADDVAPTDDRRAERPAAVQAKRITVDAAELDQTRSRELAEYIEGLGAVVSAKVRVLEDEDGNTQMLLEIAGADLPTDDDLTREIHGFGGFADAAVVVETVHPDDVAPAEMFTDEDKTPEELQAEVEERLREQGVEGEVFVDVVDGDGERRIEVRVEADTSPSGAPDWTAN